MEPLDPAKNVEGSGYSKRRISSILKAPRKSTIIRDPEQQENEVESAKATEKRNSRRVSFAPANDVLLFAKDAKNVSPTRSPLQELMTATAATTQTRVQVTATEDGGQQIMGIENLLSAPLHISQQRDMINVDSGNDGEKTVVFSSEDAVMDMTHSHTINIGNDAGLLGDTSQNYDFLLTGRERRVALDDGSTDVSLSHIGNMASGSISLSTGRNADLSRVEKKNVPAKVPCLDPGFENFLASLSKPSGSSSNAVITKMAPFAGSSSEDTNVSLGLNKTHIDDVDKENQVPKSLNTTKKIGESLNGSAFCPQNDVSMDMTEAQTGRILGIIDDDPFQCLFPTQDMYAHSDKRASQMTEIKRQPSSETLGSADPKGRKSLINPPLHTHQRPVISSNPKECREKTIMFTADDEFMDMTRSHTVSIASGSLAPGQRLDPGFNEFLVRLSKPSESSGNPEIHRMKPNTAPPFKQGMDTVGSVSQNKTPRAGAGKENWSLNTSRSSGEPFSGGIISPKGGLSTEVQTDHILGGDVSMDITEAQTGRIRVLTESDDPFQFLVPSQDLYPLCESQKKSDVTSGQQSRKGFRSPPHKDLGMETSLKPSLKTPLKRQQEKLATEDDYGEKTVKFSADDACMDVTRSHTINIATDLNPQLTRNGDFSTTCGEKTVLMSDSVNSVRKQKGENRSSSTHSLDLLTSLSKPSDYSVYPEITRMAPTPARSSNETVCPEDDMSMDMTEAQTGCILGGDVSRDMTGVQTSHIVETPGTDDPLQCRLPTEGMYQQSGKLKKAEMTSHQQSSEALGSSNSQVVGNLLKSSLKKTVQRHQIQFDAEDDCRDKTVRFSSDDACMELTQSLTANIVSKLPLQSYQNADLPANGETTGRFTEKAAAMDVTQSHTANIATQLDVLSHQHVDLLPASGEKTVRFSANDAAMDVTRSHTVNISTDLNMLSHQNVNLLPANGEKTVRFTANADAMDVTRSHTIDIATNFEPTLNQNVDLLPANTEKTGRFTANNTLRDGTQSPTVNIATQLDMLSHQNVDLLPASGEKTVRFSANDAAMDVTRSHTVNISTDLNMLSRQNLAFVTANEEKTKRFTAKAAAMDVTQSRTVNIATDLNINMLSHQNVNLLPANGEKTVRFTANADAMDVTRSHTIDIATNFEPTLNQNVDLLPANTEKTGRFTANNTLRDGTQSPIVNNPTNFGLKSNHQNADFVSTCGEKTVRFTTDDAAMDMTQSLTVNIAGTSMSDSFLPHQSAAPIHENISSSVSVRKADGDTCVPHSKGSSSAHGLDQELKNSLSETGPWAISKADAADAPFLPETQASNDSVGQLETQKPDTNAYYEAPGLVSAVDETPVNETMTDCPEISASMDMTEVQTGCILGQTCTDEPPRGLFSTQDPSSDHVRETKLTFQNIEALGSSSPDDAEIPNPPHSFDSNETETMKEHEPGTAACRSTRMMESSPNAVDQGVDAKRSRTSRRVSLADLQSKVRRLSHMINTAPDATATDSCTAPLPQSDHDLNDYSNDKPTSPPEAAPELEIGLANTQDDTQAQVVSQDEQTSAATPFNLKTKQLMSRLSVGGFKAKLPRRSNIENSKRIFSVGETTRTVNVNVTSQLNDFENDVSDICDEELCSYEDVSETLDTRSPAKVSEKESPSQEFNVFEPLAEDVFIGAVHRQKRPLPEYGDSKEGDKRLKASTEFIEQCDAVECDSDIATAHITTQSIESSSYSHSASRCEAAYESTTKHSLFESQLEDYTSDAQKKLEDGTITVLEFFKLFNIDFVIHNPRQSVVPGRLLSDTDSTSIDLLKDRHISRPKQLVYETDIQTLAEKVEGLKGRMRDLDKHLTTVNRPLLEEMRYSSEKEIKSFGAKLKERNNFFRKTSKVQHHEMKEVLNSNLKRANLEEHQKLRGTIEEADVMIKSLDDRIGELEAELAAVEEKDSEDEPSLKSLQEGMKKVTETLEDNNRQITELEMQKKQNSSKLNRLKAETRNLESHVDMLDTLHEWKIGEKRHNCTVYTFLHETVLLQLAYKKSTGNDADSGPEQKITKIAFKLELDEEKSQFNAQLVHKLVSQYIEGESAWVEKYPTRRHVPKLLHDVSLVVSRCRLLGEELRLLRMWGGLRLDILHISCMDTQVHIVFSSLKKCSKFEVVFSVSLADQLCVLHVESFNNIIGSTTIQQIEEIVAAFTPAKNLLTKIVKKIHDTLLC
ncbi:uncharacterized protein knl1 [Odontesthes bonariensis]|uniref:uncharacterized protein knl1 n=1 Tax=Odontesthes bonariensis TaxID=219752 RepID=UPI003F58035B